MPQIAVVTDSAACIPQNLVDELNIRVIPFELVWDGQHYRDGIDITPGEFYRRLRRAKSWPTTSVPALGSFAKVYTELGREADGIVSIHVAAELSGAIQTARLAAEQTASVPARIVDSRTGAIAEGFVVLAAARAAAAGGSLEEVAGAAEAATSQANLFLTLETLEYLQRGGRIGEAAALLGSRLHIHPVLRLADGRVRLGGATRSRRNALERILTLMAKQVGGRPVHASVFHADADEEATRLGAEICDRFECEEFFLTEFTPVMGAHSGPGTLGVAYWARGS